MRYVLTAFLCFLCTVSPVIGEPVIETGDRVLVLGDGFAAELGRRGVLESVLGPDVEILHHAAPGTEATSLPGPDRFDGSPVDAVIVCVGMVDAIRGDGHLPRFRRELASFAGRWADARIIMVTPVPPDPNDAPASVAHALSVARFADAVHAEAGRSGGRSIDLHGPLRLAGRGAGVPATRDGMHLSEAGWRFVEGELAWQLGVSELDPAFTLETVDGVSGPTVDQSIELEWLRHPDRMPAPEQSAAVRPVEPPGLDWDEAVERVGRSDEIGTEQLREALAHLASDSERSRSAREIMLPLTDPTRPEPVRLAALAALDDLPEALRPEDGIRTIAMEAVPVKMVYDVDRFEVEAGAAVRIVLENPDAQPHNLLILRPGSLRSIGRAVDAMENNEESKSRHWVPESPKVLHVMPMVQPGERGELRFTAPSRPGRYPFVCTYPGHWRMMNGVMTVRRKD